MTSRLQMLLQSLVPLAGVIVVFGLGAVVLFHLYWAAGGRRGAKLVIPTDPQQDGRPLFQPSALGTLVVAGFLAAVAGLALLVRSGQALVISADVARIALGLCGALFVLRAIGDFRWVGFFKSVRGTPFARWDDWLFSPFILVVGLACLAIVAATLA